MAPFSTILGNNARFMANRMTVVRPAVTVNVQINLQSSTGSSEFMQAEPACFESYQPVQTQALSFGTVLTGRSFPWSAANYRRTGSLQAMENPFPGDAHDQ